MRSQSTSATKPTKPPAHEPNAAEQAAPEQSPDVLWRRLRTHGDRVTLKPSNVIQLQRTVGNRAVHSMLASRRPTSPGAPAMKVDASNSSLELEADRAAAEVVKKLARPPIDPPGGGAGSGHAATIRPSGAPLVQRKSDGGGIEGIDVPSDIEEGIESARGSGQPLGEGVRRRMEGAFGADFTGVRIHTGSRAADLNRSLAARAFTTGADVFFSSGSFDPSTEGGQHLLAHELSHVVQQGPASRTIHRFRLGEVPFKRGYEKIYNHPDWHAEAEAYEKRLGAFCYKHPRATTAAKKGLERMVEVLSTYFKEQNKTDKQIAEGFFKDDTSSAGQVGVSDAEAKLKKLLHGGNLRERMTALYNAAYYKAGYGKDLGVSLKGLLHDLTINKGSFDAEKSEELGLDTEGLRAQSGFLLGKQRKVMKGAIKKKQPDKKYAADKDIFALGNLNYQHSNAALVKMVRSQAPRVDRSAAEKAHGSKKKTPRDYAQLHAPLSNAEKKFLSEKDKPLLISQMDIDVTKMVGTHKDPNTSNELKLDKDAHPGWGDHEEMETLNGTPHLKRRVVTETNEELGTRQVLEVIYAFTDANEPAKNPDKTRAIEKITWKQYILHPSQSWLSPDKQGPELPLDWIEGGAWFTYKEQRSRVMEGWYDEVHDALHMPVVAGMSGTTTRMLDAMKWLKGGVDMLDFRLAVMGWMLTSYDHSLNEILEGARVAGVWGGTERLDDVRLMYQNIPPFTKDELREGVGPLPHEIIYMKMAQEGDTKDANGKAVGPLAPNELEQMGQFASDNYSQRLFEPGPDVIERALDAHKDAQDIADEAIHDEEHANDQVKPAFHSKRMNMKRSDMAKALEAQGMDVKGLKKMSEAHVTALMGYTGGYHHYMNDVLSFSKPLALRRIKGKLKKQFKSSCLFREVQDIKERIKKNTATEADKRRLPAAEREQDAITIPAHENENIATYNLASVKALEAEVAAAAPGSEERARSMLKLMALAERLGAELYEELLVHANMTAEALEMLPPAKGKVWRGDWKVGGRPRVFEANSTFTVDTMTSASRDQSIALGFALKYRVMTPHLLEITLSGKGARDISFLSRYANEAEALLMPGTRIHVTKVTEKRTGSNQLYKLVECVEQ